MSDWAAIFSVVAGLVFAIYYPGYLESSKGCTVFKLWRMLPLGAIEFFVIGANPSHANYFIAILVAFAIVIVVFLRNKHDTGSWWHGILMTLWQSLVFMIFFYIFIGISNDSKKKDEEDLSERSAFYVH